MNKIIRYLGKDARGLRTRGLYPVLRFSDRHLPIVMTDYLESAEVTDYAVIDDGKPEKQEFDSVDVPFHYASTSIECIDAMESAFGKEFVRHFCIGNAFKYLWRHDKKGNPIEDIQKCRRYLEMFLKSFNNGSEENKCQAVRA